jgi:hypothetical protein
MNDARRKPRVGGERPKDRTASRPDQRTQGRAADESKAARSRWTDFLGGVLSNNVALLLLILITSITSIGSFMGGRCNGVAEVKSSQGDAVSPTVTPLPTPTRERPSLQISIVSCSENPKERYMDVSYDARGMSTDEALWLFVQNSGNSTHYPAENFIQSISGFRTSRIEIPHSRSSNMVYLFSLDENDVALTKNHFVQRNTDKSRTLGMERPPGAKEMAREPAQGCPPRVDTPTPQPSITPQPSPTLIKL